MKGFMMDLRTLGSRWSDALPEGGLFDQRSWRCGPELVRLPAETLKLFDRLGRALWEFQKACDRLYLNSAAGKAPEYIARWLDAGKPPELVELARSRSLRGQVPRVLRPDLLWTDDGVSLCELDSIPGGIGATTWLQETAAHLGLQPLGGPSGMRTAWNAMFPSGDILISREAAMYRPEMEWLAQGCPDLRVVEAGNYAWDHRPIYRFFEGFDLAQLPRWNEWKGSLIEGAGTMTPPMKPHLEEKLWLALFWMKPLHELWRRELGEKTQRLLEQIIPYGWVVSPDPLPPHAVLPRLDAASWEEVGRFSQKRRRLVLKVSGFSELAWGSRGVTFGHDEPQEVWEQTLKTALAEFSCNPRILQEFVASRITEVPWYDPDSDSVQTMQARARLCPYYFVGADDVVRLGGVLATLVPSSKKAIHGMSESVMTLVDAQPLPSA
jgi:hypothetical protein